LQDTLNTAVSSDVTKVKRSNSDASMTVGRRVRVRKWLPVVIVIFSDILLAFAVWPVAIIFRDALRGGPLSDIAAASIVPNAVAWVGLRAALGLYPGYGLDQVEELRRQTFALLATLAIITVFTFASQTGNSLSRLVIFGWFLLLLLLAPVMRYFVKRILLKLTLWGKPVVVLGAQQTGAHVLKTLQREWQLGFKPVAIFDNRIAPAGGMLEGVPYGGTLSDAVAFARKHSVDTAIFDMPRTRREHLAEFVQLARLTFRHVMIIPNLGGITNSAVVARNLAGTSAVEIKYNLLDPWAQRLKRVLDVVATVVGGALLFPLILVLCLLVWTESRRPIFYTDQRMGRDGQLFSCIKFRTMVPDAEALLQRMLAEDEEMREEYLNYHKLRNDPRVTRVGRFLRKTSLDELPQLWNVVRGEMSLVGPRPYLPRESEDIGRTQNEILRVTPGITGPWQVTGRNGTTFNERVRMDASYVHNWSVWLDLVLLASTVRCLLFSRDAY
jgi:Undecaprenyl-phosphate galactose phosphotransferase WbaP